jgi:hypothetical protein
LVAAFGSILNCSGVNENTENDAIEGHGNEYDLAGDLHSRDFLGG